MNVQAWLKKVKSEIIEISVDEYGEAYGEKRGREPGAGALLIDVREGEEWQEGFIPGATWIPRGKLELRIEDVVADRGREIIVYCAGGTRSAYAARTLAELGYGRVKSLAGGFTAWKRAGLAFEKPFTLTAEQKSRYARHLMLAEVGDKGQEKLLKARVLLLGAGGLEIGRAHV